jgi:hypothetical protein
MLSAPSMAEEWVTKSDTHAPPLNSHRLRALRGEGSLPSPRGGDQWVLVVWGGSNEPTGLVPVIAL